MPLMFSRRSDVGVMHTLAGCIVGILLEDTSREVLVDSAVSREGRHTLGLGWEFAFPSDTGSCMLDLVSFAEGLLVMGRRWCLFEFV